MTLYTKFITPSSNKLYRQAKRNRLLKKDFNDKDAAGFRERNLNDTRYICRFFKNYVEQYLQLHTDSTAKRCVVLSGSLTSLLRARWGLLKVRGANDRHHALDAVVVAACGHQVVQRLSTLVNAAGWAHKPEMGGYVQVETGEFLSTRDFVNRDEVYRLFPRPWRHFRDELMARLNMDDPEQLRAAATQFGTYPPAALENLHPLFVSRAPQRRNGGAVHKETIYAQPERLKAQSGVTQKVDVVTLKLADVDKLIDPHRNVKLYAALSDWIGQRDEREKCAKAIEKSAKEAKRALSSDEKIKLDRLRALPRKPDRNGDPTGPIVRTVTLVIDKLSGIPIRGGIAKNDTMLRVDVFTKAGKFHLVPVYVHHRVTGLPNRAIVAFKDEEHWTLIDETFAFCFSLYSNDLVRVSQKGKVPILGYYGSCHRGTGNMNIWVHDRNQTIGKDGQIEGIGVKTALSIEKFNVDVLGNIYPAPAELRRDLA